MRPSPSVAPVMRATAFLGLAASLSACATDDFGAPLEFATPDTAVEYEVVVEGAPNEEVEELLRESLTLFIRQDEGAQSRAFLRRRAREDVETVQRVLRSFGYYGSEIDVTVVEPEAVAALAPEELTPEEVARDSALRSSDRPQATAPLPVAAAAAVEPEEVEDEDELPLTVVTIEIDAGEPFILASHDFVLSDYGLAPPDLPPADAFGSPVGRPAAAREILDAEAGAVTWLRAEGRPYAEYRDRDSLANLDTEEIRVESYIFSGPAYVYGDLTFVGLEDVEQDYLRTYRNFEPGEVWDAADLRELQNDLVETNLFNVVRVTPPEDPPPGAAAPVIVTVEERPFRTIQAGVRYSTDQGPAVRTAFEHRNLFGGNETLFLEALASGFTGAAGFGNETVLGDGQELRFLATYREPQFYEPGQDLLIGFEARDIEDDAFDETAATLTAGVERELTRRLSYGVGGLLEYTRITDEGETNEYQLVGLPAFVRYDGSNNLLNPTEGARLRVDATPFTGFRDDGGTPLFTRLDAVGSAYYGIDEDDRYVVAARARVGSIVTADEDDVPKSRRLYSGGGGSIRGYEERSIGPLDDDGDPEGGLSVVELQGEARAQVYGDLGVVAFAGAGAVGEDSYPTLGDPQYAAGGGFRYYSPVGPIRLDVAFPLNPREEDDAWQLYVSIGQAF